MAIGALVRAENGKGVGKVVAMEGGCATVSYFQSMTQQDRVEIPVSALRRVRVAPQTRCYIRSGEEGPWLAGRIGQCIDFQYEIHLPEKRSLYLPEAQVYVRCAGPPVDPIEVLAVRGHETAFFHHCRSPLARMLVEQRAATRGMSGLVSSRIELHAHQVEVVRRVLEDPIQRYLLADEVGLGKTIEAGVILRQFLLDEPVGDALVLVPPLLEDQWVRELDEKLAAFELGGRVQVLSTDEFRVDAAQRWRFLIIDEAHHVAELASSASPADRARFEAFRRLAHEAERVLLLSATPALHNEAAFLAMLHLLDPAVYRLEDIDAFRGRVERRQEVGRLLFAFNEGMAGFSLRRNINRLREMFPSDTVLGEIVNELEAAAAQPETDSTHRDRLIRRIRVYLAEGYRLHQRMLRNRRETVETGLTAGRRGAGRTDFKIEYDLDDAGLEVHEILEEWRIAAWRTASASGEELRGHPLLDVFRILLEAAGTWLGFLALVVRVRLDEETSGALRRDLPVAQVKRLCETAFFPGEEELLRALLELCDRQSRDQDRISLLAEVLRPLLRPSVGSTDHPPKIVVFTSFYGVAGEIHTRLAERWGPQAVVLYRTDMGGEGVEQAIRQFAEGTACNVLVCDVAGEEGRNLQFADILIHFDLPVSANRLEQRIGRLDRIGRVRPLQTRLLLGPDCENSLFEAWYAFLSDGLGAFDSSIAGLQFFIDRAMPKILEAMFTNGAAGLQEHLSTVRAEIEEEKLRLNEQYSLDEIDARMDDAREFFEHLEAFDMDHVRLRQDTERWIVDALNMRSITQSGESFVVQYQPERRTLIPHDFLLHRLGRHVGRRGTYRRTTAAQTEGVVLYRIGETFVDTIADYLAWDDRGQAFAIWRVERNWDPTEGLEWTGFRFDYVIEADLAPAIQAIQDFGVRGGDLHALRRRADALYPPQVETIFVRSDGEEVTDPAILTVLRRPFRKLKDYGTDFNLTKHRAGALDLVIDASRWPAVCRSVRIRSADLLRSRADVVGKLDTCATRAARNQEIRTERLRLRQSLNPEANGDLEFEEALGRALIAGIRSPILRPDAVGFIAVSGRNPLS